MFSKIVFALILVVVFGTVIFAEEGMFPLNQINQIDLRAKGLLIDPDEIFNEKEKSISDAIVNIGGCTGSFVSKDGLILTNHHCAFRAVREASAVDNDYLKNGFLANDRSEEVEAKGYTVRITDSYRDVSKEILDAVKGIEDLGERHNAILKKRKEIVARIESDNPGKRAEVAEMFTGESYVLFIYTYIKDVRMVYVPPRSIGEFGGEFDNWEWPRHNADFAFMRAYVAPDGSPADYSEENVPYHPKKHLNVAAKGAEEGDFVFILGYPARTYKHRTSHFLDFEEQLRMPFVVDWYQWQIALMEEMGKDDPAKALKYTSRIKGLSNTEKNYRGKLQGMRRLALVENKQKEEQQIQNFIENNNQLKTDYSGTLENIDRLFQDRKNYFYEETILSYLFRSVNTLSYANTIYKTAEELEKEDLERESAYMDRNFERTKKRVFISLNSYDEAVDKLILKELLTRAANLADNNRIKVLDEMFNLKTDLSKLDQIIESAYSTSRLNDAKYISELFAKNFEEMKKEENPFIRWVVQLQPKMKEIKERNEKRNGALTKLSAQWAEVKKQYSKKEFIPDANRTFRLTYGYIKGYSPADAVYKSPQTTLTGVIEKTTNQSPYDTPEGVLDLYNKKDFGSFPSKKLNDLPVGILYSTDTSGGNSGSPVLNAKGELIGLNFDRTFEATINDFAWSESYSRSIGVDIRYVLWITQKFAEADHILEEIGI